MQSLNLPPRKKTPEVMIRQIRGMRAAGLTVRQIAAELEMPLGTVGKFAVMVRSPLKKKRRPKAEPAIAGICPTCKHRVTAPCLACKVRNMDRVRAPLGGRAEVGFRLTDEEEQRRVEIRFGNLSAGKE